MVQQYVYSTKKCDLDKKARMPARPGRTYKVKSSDNKAEWKVIAKSEPTCIGGENKIVEKKGLTLEKCKELANSDKTANFIWFAVQKMPNSNPSVCHLYKKCDLKEKARYPERPGRT